VNPTTPVPQDPEPPQVTAVETPVHTLAQGKGSIHKRIARVQSAVADMKPDKTATITMKNGGQYSFDYISKSALEVQARKLFAPEEVAVIVSEETITQNGNRCIVTVQITLSCDEGSVVIRRSGYGNADDDKGPAKAGTTAVRLALGDLLLQGGDEVAGEDTTEYRADVVGQALQAGDQPATRSQIQYAIDLIMRSQLDRAMPTAAHALVRLARAVSQVEIAPGVPANDAVSVIPAKVISKVIERIENVQPAGARSVWEKVAAWEVEAGFSPDVDAGRGELQPIKPDLQPTGEGDDSIPF
jgi:hypothetical protein